LLLLFILIQVVHGQVHVLKAEDIYKLYDSNLTTSWGSYVWTSVAVVFVLILFGTIFFFNRFMQHELTEYAVVQPVANMNEAKDTMKTSKRETKKEENKDTTNKEKEKEAIPTSTSAPDSTMTAAPPPKNPILFTP
ncbi:hypothetical protein PENTCL1PPCAC_26818, partial [Pristionchus entomophagus]